jgi:hypothetical protein
MGAFGQERSLRWVASNSRYAAKSSRTVRHEIGIVSPESKVLHRVQAKGKTLSLLSLNALRDNLRRDNESGRAKLGLNHDFRSLKN